MNRLLTIASLTIILISSATEARMNKCIVNGKTMYQDKQCDSNASASVSMQRKRSSEVNRADSMAADKRAQQAKDFAGKQIAEARVRIQQDTKILELKVKMQAALVKKHKYEAQLKIIEDKIAARKAKTSSIISSVKRVRTETNSIAASLLAAIDAAERKHSAKLARGYR